MSRHKFEKKNPYAFKKGHKAWNRGLRLPLKTRRRMSDARKGNKGYWQGKTRSIEDRQKMSKSHEGQRSYWIGKPRPKETKDKISKILRGKVFSKERREKMLKYKGEERKEYLAEVKAKNTPEYIKWRTEVLKKNDRKCYVCDEERKGRMQAHHLTSYIYDKKNRYDVNNGVPLCKKCHNIVHRGRKKKSYYQRKR
jgi:hypothetical protein